MDKVDSLMDRIFFDHILDIQMWSRNDLFYFGKHCDEIDKIFHWDNVDPRDQRSLCRIFFGEKNTSISLFFSENSRRKNRTHWAKNPVECELSDKEGMLQKCQTKIKIGAKNSNRDRQIEARSFFPDICWSEIDRDSRRRKTIS